MNKQLKELITLLVKDKEREVGVKLSIEDFDFLIRNTTMLAQRNIDKFVKGVAKHGDDFQTNVAHLDEAVNEILDMFNYVMAARDKMRKYDERYK